MKEMCAFSADSMEVQLEYRREAVQQAIAMRYSGGERLLYRNRSLCSSWAALLGALQAVCLHPGDFLLVGGAPHLRRHFLDLQIAQCNPTYVQALRFYRQALRQRNALLRRGGCSTLPLWEAELASSAAVVVATRRQLCDALQKELDQLPGAQQISYRPSGVQDDSKELKELFLERFAETRPRDIERGVTQLGPHRDKLLFFSEGKEVVHYCSEGQRRRFITDLKWAEWRCMERRTGEQPLLLLDEVGLGLDAHHQGEVAEKVQEAGQVITSSVAPPPYLSGELLTLPGPLLQEA